MEIMKAVHEFLDFKRSYCAAASIKYYRENLYAFKKWLCDYLKIDFPVVNMLTRKLYTDYLLYLRSLNIKNVSVNTYIRAVKVFVRWCFDEGYLDDDITQRAKYPRADASFIYPLTTEEVLKLDECFDVTDYLGLRDYCIFHLMLDCGLRSGEVVDLKKQHILDKALLIFNGKWNKSRHVPLPDALHQQLDNLINLYGGYGDNVFFDRYVKDLLTENSIKRLFQRLKKKSGVKRVHAHLCRHTFASSYIYYGGGMEMLRLLLGHSSYNVTQNYLHIASQMLIVGYDMYKVDDVFFNLTLLNRR